MIYRVAVILALLAQAPSPTPNLVYWECNGVVRETTVEEMAKIGCESSVFTVADGGDQNPQATPYGEKTPKSLPTPPPSGMALKWDESVGLLANNATADVSVWSVNCKDAKVCNAFKATDNGRTLFVIADGDGPAGVGGPCDLGKLVRAAKEHISAEHSWSMAMVDQLRGNQKSLPGAQARMLESVADLQTQLAHCEPKKPEPASR